MQRSGTEAIRTQIQPSKPKREKTNTQCNLSHPIFVSKLKVLGFAVPVTSLTKVCIFIKLE